MEPTAKKCLGCRVEKPLTEYRSNGVRQVADGGTTLIYRARCKPCDFSRARKGYTEGELADTVCLRCDGTLTYTYSTSKRRPRIHEGCRADVCRKCRQTKPEGESLNANGECRACQNRRLQNLYHDRFEEDRRTNRMPTEELHHLRRLVGIPLEFNPRETPWGKPKGYYRDEDKEYGWE